MLELNAYVRELAQENPVIELEDSPAPPQADNGDELLSRLRWLEDNDSQNWFYQRFSDDELDPLARIGTGGGLEEMTTAICASPWRSCPARAA